MCVGLDACVRQMSSKVETATDVPRAVAFPWRDLNSTGPARDTPHLCLPRRLSDLVSIYEQCHPCLGIREKTVNSPIRLELHLQPVARLRHSVRRQSQPCPQEPQRRKRRPGQKRLHRFPKKHRLRSWQKTGVPNQQQTMERAKRSLRPPRTATSWRSSKRPRI
jgi:hypothetical protein